MKLRPVGKGKPGQAPSRTQLQRVRNSRLRREEARRQARERDE